MRADQLELWDRLQAFDVGSGSDVFVSRLARENHWSLDFARRVCAEYRCFALLAVAAGHPCTPSDEVDQAWHLHMLHTRDYWDVFCGQVLRMPLHHTPSAGGAEEAAKFRGWYARTLESYAEFFGRAAPTDIWPAVCERFQNRSVRVDRRCYWLVPKLTPMRLRPSARLLQLALLCLTAAGCSAIVGMPPFSLSDSSFVSFYALAFAASLLVARQLRQAYEATAPQTLCELETYECAYLTGGPERVTHTAIAALMAHADLTLNDKGRLIASEERIPRLDAFERLVYESCWGAGSGGVEIEALTSELSEKTQVIYARLERAGLYLPRGVRVQRLRVSLLVPLIGSLQLLVGLATGAPVGLLFLSLCLSWWLVVTRFGSQLQLTAAGETLRAQLRRYGVQRDGDTAPATLAYYVAVLGPACLAGTELHALGERLQSPPSQASDSTQCGGGGCGGCGGCGGS